MRSSSFALLCFAVLFIVLPCFALLCIALLCIAFALRCIAVNCFALPCFVLPCFALHCCALLRIALLCIAFALLCISLPCFALLSHCFALLCLAFPCFALLCIALGSLLEALASLLEPVKRALGSSCKLLLLLEASWKLLQASWSLSKGLLEALAGLMLLSQLRCKGFKTPLDRSRSKLNQNMLIKTRTWIDQLRCLMNGSRSCRKSAPRGPKTGVVGVKGPAGGVQRRGRYNPVPPL